MNSLALNRHIQNIYQSNNTARGVTGSQGEKLACAFLQRKGYVWLCSNAHTHWGEIDLVMKHPLGSHVFVEVKTKRSARFGSPEEAFHSQKRTKLGRAIEWFCLKNRIDQYQVDLVAIDAGDDTAEIRHYPNVEM